MVGQVPFNAAYTISPDDSQNLAPYATQQQLTGAVYVGALGNVAVVMEDGYVSTFLAVPAGTFLQVACKRVNATGTTALNLLACYWK
jgi:hypothetical protein